MDRFNYRNFILVKFRSSPISILERHSFSDIIISRYTENSVPMVKIKRMSPGFYSDYFIFNVKELSISSYYLLNHSTDGISHNCRTCGDKDIFHSISSPAITMYSDSENITREIWARDGYFHRIDGPADMVYDSVGLLEEYWYTNHRRIRTDGHPSAIIYGESRLPSSWIWNMGGKDLPDVDEWISDNHHIYGISKNWWEWSNDEKMIFKLAYDPLL